MYHPANFYTLYIRVVTDVNEWRHLKDLHSSNTGIISVDTCYNIMDDAFSYTQRIVHNSSDIMSSNDTHEFYGKCTSAFQI